MMEKHQKYTLSAVLLTLLTGATLLFYFNHSLNLIQQDYQARIQDIAGNLKSLKESMEMQLDILNSNLSLQIGTVSSALDNFKRQNQLQINALSGLIDEIEQQSNIQLNELKDELKDIQIKSADFSAIVDDVLQSVVSVKTNNAQGSGVIIDARGFIVTNVHVLEGASTIRAVTYSGKTYNAALVGSDEAVDVAVLKIDAVGLDALNYGDADEVKVGEKVLAAGNPAGLSFTVTEGIVSAFRRFDGIDYIQTDVPINPGNSGGPLINTKGEVIGINNFKVSNFESLGFAIASDEVKSITDGIISEWEALQNQ